MVWYYPPMRYSRSVLALEGRVCSRRCRTRRLLTTDRRGRVTVHRVTVGPQFDLAGAVQLVTSPGVFLQKAEQSVTHRPGVFGETEMPALDSLERAAGEVLGEVPSDTGRHHRVVESVTDQRGQSHLVEWSGIESERGRDLCLERLPSGVLLGAPPAELPGQARPLEKGRLECTRERLRERLWVVCGRVQVAKRRLVDTLARRRGPKKRECSRAVVPADVPECHHPAESGTD